MMIGKPLCHLLEQSKIKLKNHIRNVWVQSPRCHGWAAPARLCYGGVFPPSCGTRRAPLFMASTLAHLTLCFHQRTPVPNLLVRSLVKQIPDGSPALDHYSRSLRTECVVLLLVKPSWSRGGSPAMEFGFWVLPDPPVFPPDRAFFFFSRLALKK